MNDQSGSKRYRFAIDTGGTVTDAFFFDEATGETSVTKVPSRPDEAAMTQIKAVGISPSAIKLLTDGITVATNALITRKLSRAAMVCARDHRDVVEIRDGTKPDLRDTYTDVAPPYPAARPFRGDRAGGGLQGPGRDAAR